MGTVRDSPGGPLSKCTISLERFPDIDVTIINGMGGVFVALDLDDPITCQAIQEKQSCLLDIMKACDDLKDEARIVLDVEYLGVDYYFKQSEHVSLKDKINHLEIVAGSQLARGETKSKIVLLSAWLHKKLDNNTTKTKQVARPVKGGYIYLIKALIDGEPYKIGWARKARSRLKLFEVNLPFGFETIHVFAADNPQEAESSLHKSYKNKRAIGEWFILDDLDVANICSIDSYKDGRFDTIEVKE